MNTWYEVSGMYDGKPYVMTPCDDLPWAESLVEVLAENGYTELFIVVRNN